MNAMIFAAGLGTRLRPLTNNCPKAMVKVAGRPMLYHLIMRLKEAGFDHLVINVHHFGEQIIEYVRANNNFGLHIRISDERQLLLDTGGGIKQALPLYDEPGPILIHNVDIVTDLDLRALYNEAIRPNRVGETPAASLFVQQRKTSRYLLVDPDSHDLCGWTNIKTGELKNVTDASPYLMRAFSGIHVVNPALFPLLERQEESAFPVMDFYLQACRQAQISTFDLPTTARWVDCGKPESLSLATEILI